MYVVQTKTLKKFQKIIISLHVSPKATNNIFQFCPSLQKKLVNTQHALQQRFRRKTIEIRTKLIYKNFLASVPKSLTQMG